MSIKTRTFTLFSAALAALLVLAATFSACESTLGFGDAIDFVLPELTLDPGPNPQYVTYTSTITGKITDNIAVDRVEMREAISGKHLFTAAIYGDSPREKRWSIVLDFRRVTLDLKSGRKAGMELNGERIGAEIVGYDKMGNSHVAAITLIIDMRAPFTTDIEIERTSIGNKRTGFIEPLDDYLHPITAEIMKGLKDLETSDPNGFVSANANKYQNGRFTIKAKLDENETRIKSESVRLNIYDEDHQNEPLLSLERDPATPENPSTVFSPVWSLLDEDIITAGTAKGWTKEESSYANAYHGGKRFYYRVEVVAIDETDDKENELHDDMGWFCMWQDGDIPKGVLDQTFAGDDPNTASYVDRGTPLPVEFFDDDALEWAYAGLLTKAQWEGTKTDDQGVTSDAYIASGVKIPQYPGDSQEDDKKLEWLKKRLKGEANAGDVYNWKYDIYLSTPTKHETITPILDILDEYEKTAYIETGNEESDYGEFVLFTLTADKKLPPHDASYTGNIETLKPQWKGRAWKIQVIDSNAPLIVFDTVDTTLPPPDYEPSKHPGNDPDIPGAATGNSPEENTFPRLSEGRYFEINGYTLRENGNGHNTVNAFRVAWIPFSIAGGPDSKIKDVQEALSYYDANHPFPAGVQHWDLHGSMVEGTPQPINGIDFRKQVFRKKFDVLGGPDDVKPEYNNFTYNDFENETKLFVFYAKDNAGHEVFRQLRLLGNKTPPNIAVYDLTNRSITVTEGPPNGLPDLNSSEYPNNPNYYFFNATTGLIDTAGRARYEATRKAYQPTAFNLLKAVAMPANTLLLGPGDIATANAAYPMGTVIKYWVAAQSNGDLAVDDVFMRDITFSDNPDQVGHYDDGISLSYIEKVSEVTQRVFLFEATDSLGNTARIQRTVAVTNAAVLNSITTTTQTGSYGIGTTITLQANFSNLVRWEGTNPPLLNVRYNYHGTSQLRQIATSTAKGQPSLSLDFPITVEESDTGVLETMYFEIPNSNGHTQQGTEADKTNRPITIPAGTSLLDSSRGDEAFTPRNSAGFDWTTSRGSLQPSKTITLQGIRPRITAFAIASASTTGKTNYITDADTNLRGYYFKADETIEFTLTADNPIFTGTTAPVIQFQVADNATWRNAAWSRSISDRIMSFGVLVNSANTPLDGRITAIQLNNINSIVDSVGNAFPSAGTGSPANTIALSTNIHIDKTPPTAPGTTLDTVTVGGLTERLYNNNPVLAIPANTSGETAPVAATQYSLNNGVTWRTFPNVESTLGWTSAGAAANTLNILNGQWTLVTRYTDRAGNEGAVTNQPLHVNRIFPNLIAVTAVQPGGWYKAGANLSFTLDFAEAVRVDTETNVQIVLTNRGSTANTGGTGNNNHILSAATGQTSITRTGNTTITFAWNAISSKEMRDGMYISRINLNGLRDRFGNTGPAAANITYNASTTAPSPISGAFANPAINNLNVNVKVDAIAPTVPTTNPANSTGIANTFVGGGNYNNRIILTFNEPVIKGNGTITIQPKADFLVPPVFEDTGYYLQYSNQQKVSESGATGSTIWMPGFYDIYNSGLSADHRNYLTQGTTAARQAASPSSTSRPSDLVDGSNPSMTRLVLDQRTGQPVGPYVKTTHGLVEGYGYSGDYSGNHAANTVNGPNTDGTNGNVNGTNAYRAMIPDTSTKWVLAYQHSIVDASTTGTIPNIRTALKAAKFRQQEIDVAWSNVTINGAEVTITLNEPLLQGLQWTLFYTAGTFTDNAGNEATALVADSYTFWSPGVQKPVIRVDRKSYDARTANWWVPTTTANHAGSFTYAEPTGDWAIGAFNTINYRIESESRDATITYGVTSRSNSTTTAGTGSFNAVTVNAGTTNQQNQDNTGGIPGDYWSGTITGGTGYTDTTWQAPAENRNSFWVRPNLLRKFGTSGTRSFHTVNGDERRSSGSMAFLHSYNRDAQKGTLDAAINGTNFAGGTGTATGSFTGTVGFTALEAGKSYIVATATNNATSSGASARGYEGIFRTLVVLNGQRGNRTYENNASTSDGINKILAGGSNTKSGTPSIAGFPLLDGAQTGDARFVKMMHNFDNHGANNAAITNTGKRFYWVSTEIVSEFYFAYFGNGGNVQRTGDVNNYLMVRYGDLSYAYRLDRFPDGNSY